MENRLTDDDLIELLGTLGVLRLEVQELRKTAESMVPRDELGNRWRRLRLVAFIAMIAMLVVFVPFGFVLNQVSDTAKSARNGQTALIQDQYDRAVASEAQCRSRNDTQAAVVVLVQRLLAAELREVPSPARDDRIAAFNLALRGAGSLADCSPFVNQQKALLAKGAKPHS